MRVSSNVGVARDAVSGFSAVTVDRSTADQATGAGSTTVVSVHNAAKVADRLLEDICLLISDVKEHAGKVTTLAATMEARDAQDAGTLAAGRVV